VNSTWQADRAAWQGAGARQRDMEEKKAVAKTRGRNSPVVQDHFKMPFKVKTLRLDWILFH